MKRIFTFLSFIFLFSSLYSQEVPDNWTDDSGIDTYKESTTVHGGSYSCKISVNTGSQSNCDFDNQTSIPVTAGESYTVKFWYQSSAHVKGRLVLHWTGASTSYGQYTNQDVSSWTEFSYSSTVPSGATAVQIGIRYYDQSGFSPGEIQYIDDLTFESPTGTSQTVTNGDLESWPTSNDSDAYAGDTGSQPAAGTISSVNNDEESEAMDVFNMTLYDDGTSDGLPTHVTRIRIKPALSNTANWIDNIQGMVVKDGATIITTSSVDITNTNIDINFTSGDLDVTDGSTKTITIAVYLNTSNIEDGKILSFMVDVDNHGFTADASGTQFKSDFGGGDFYSNDFTIDVTFDEVRFTNQPSDVPVNQVMAPAVEVSLTDGNGNVDLDADGSGYSVGLTTTGSFDPSATTEVDAVQGIATFDNLIFDTEATGITLTTTDPDGWGWTNVTSNTFDVTAAAASPGDIVINEYMANPSCEGDAVGEYIEFYNTTGSAIDINGWIIEDDGSDSHTIDNANGTTVVPAGGYLVCGIDGSSTCSPDYVYSGITLSNGGDEIIIKNGSTEICRVNYSNGDQFGAGKSCQLPDNYDYSLADDGVINENEYIEPNTTYGCGDYGTPGGENTLPLNLLNFVAKKLINQTLVSWTTSSEFNNDHFSLEWSTDGKEFKEMAQIKSKGNHKENQEYSYVHKNPAQGTNYYRLTQYDLDGRSQTFDVVSVTFDFEKYDMIIAPNKVINNLRIEFSQAVEKASLLIYDMEGKLVQSSILASGIDIINLDVSGLSPGQYIVRLVDKKGTLTKKFVKM